MQHAAQTWPMPSATERDAEDFRRRSVPHATDRRSHLHDWATWLQQAPLAVIEEHLALASTLNPTLADLGLTQPPAAWTDTAWSRFWSLGGHASWAEICAAARSDDSGAVLGALEDALVATDRVDAVSVILWRLRAWDRGWTRDVIARRVERHGAALIADGAQQGVGVIDAVATPIEAALKVDRLPATTARLAAAGARRVGVRVHVLPM